MVEMKRKKQRIAIAAAGIFLVAAAAFLILKPPADPLAAVPSELAEQVTLTPTENLPGHVVLEAYYTPLQRRQTAAFYSRSPKSRQPVWNGLFALTMNRKPLKL